MCSILFFRDVLKRERKLLKVSEAQSIPNIPKYPEINVKSLWNEIKEDKNFQAYFPKSMLQSQVIPDRTYFFTVNLKDICIVI